VDLGLTDLTATQFYTRRALALPPAGATVRLFRTPSVSNPCAGRDRFWIADLTEDLKVHPDKLPSSDTSSHVASGQLQPPDSQPQYSPLTPWG
jgi:hypothetical protein